MKIGNAIRQDGHKLDYGDYENFIFSDPFVLEYELKAQIWMLMMKTYVNISPTNILNYEDWRTNK